MSKFSRIFMDVLAETNTMDRKAMGSLLDPNTDIADFDATPQTQGTDPTQGIGDEVVDALTRKNQTIIDTLQNWIDRTDDFLQFLNSEDPTSIQSQLAAAESETIMDKMKQSQQTKISRVASDLAGFHQSLLGFMAQTRNARFKNVLVPLSFGLSLLHVGMGYFS